MGQEEKQLHTWVAWSYYNEEVTRADIAEKLGIPRVRVNRLCLQVDFIENLGAGQLLYSHIGEENFAIAVIFDTGRA